MCKIKTISKGKRNIKMPVFLNEVRYDISWASAQHASVNGNGCTFAFPGDSAAEALEEDVGWFLIQGRHTVEANAAYGAQ